MNTQKQRISSWLATLFVAASAQIVSAQDPAPAAEPTQPQPSALVPASAAEPAPAQPAGDNSKEEVITLATFTVTGTQIRGIEPIGTNIVPMDKIAITKTGAKNTNDLVAKVPQSGLFNTLPTPSIDWGSAIVRPMLRGLSGGTTLVLMDGHRVVGAGVLQTDPDLSIIPPGMIERVDIVPDGGSSIYGADAVGGVINTILRKKFDGTEVTTHYGVSDAYHAFNANLTTGTSWKDGSAVLSYNFTKHDAILGQDRDYDTADHRAWGGTDKRSVGGGTGQITAGGNLFAAATFAPITAPIMYNPNLSESIYPEETRRAIFASVSQKLLKNLDFFATAFWSNRKTQNYSGQRTFAATIRPQSNPNAADGVATPFFHAVAGESSQTIASNYAYVPLFGASRISSANFTSEGFSPEFTIKLGNDWQVRVPLTAGFSDNRNNDRRNINSAAEATALANGELNPYNLAASNSRALADINNYGDDSWSTQKLYQAEAIADGPIFTLPGGAVRTAVGVGYMRQSIDAVSTHGRVGENQNYYAAAGSKSTKSVFVELNIPVFSKRNSIAGVRSLKLVASGRYDNYSDFGATTNPKVGFTYEPVSGVTLRASYGKSYNAPGLADTTASVDSRAQDPFGGISPFLRPGDPFFPNFFRQTILIAGGNPGLKPQKADIWSAGADLDVKAVKGLTLTATYYRTKLTDTVGVAPFWDPSLLFNGSFDNLYVLNPTEAQLRTLVGTLPLDGWTWAQAFGGGNSPYLMIDATRRNFGTQIQSGVDFGANYAKTTSFGNVHANVNGNYMLRYDQQYASTAPWTDVLKTSQGRLSYSAGLGVVVGRLAADARFDYSPGHHVDPSPTSPRDWVQNFYTVNLFLAYDLSHKGAAGKRWNSDLSLTLNLGNILDRDPSFNDNAPGGGFGPGALGGTLGRFVDLGVTKKF